MESIFVLLLMKVWFKLKPFRGKRTNNIWKDKDSTSWTDNLYKNNGIFNIPIFLILLQISPIVFNWNFRYEYFWWNLVRCQTWQIYCRLFDLKLLFCVLPTECRFLKLVFIEFTLHEYFCIILYRFMVFSILITTNTKNTINTIFWHSDFM